MAYLPPGSNNGGAGGVPQLPAGYAQALQQSYAPYFQQSQDDLEGTLASQGILSSGAGSKQLQDLTARNNATYAQGLDPLIAQGFQQQFQGQEFNADQKNQFALAQMGYANQDYLQQLGSLSGLYSQGLGAEGGILQGGSSDATQGYQYGEDQGAQYGYQGGYSPYGGGGSYGGGGGGGDLGDWGYGGYYDTAGDSGGG